MMTQADLKCRLRFQGLGIFYFILREGASLMLCKESQGFHLGQTSCTVICEPVNVWRREPMHETCMQRRQIGIELVLSMY